MQVYRVIARRVKEIGITKAELARRINMDGELLRRSLMGKRKITAEELILLCYRLNLDLSDFSECRDELLLASNEETDESDS